MNTLQCKILAGMTALALSGTAMAVPEPVAGGNPGHPSASSGGIPAAVGQTPADRVSQPGPKLPVVDVATLLSRNLQARGGESGWKAVNTLHFTGKMDAGRARPDPDNGYASPTADAKERRKSRIQRERDIESAPVVQLPFILDVARGRKSHLELVVNDQVAVQTYDGKQGWKLMPFLGGDYLDHPSPYSAEELKLASDQSDLDGWLIEAQRQHYRVEQLAPEMVEGKPAYHLQLTLPGGDQRGVWLDAQSWLEVKIEGARRFNGQVKPMYTYLSDYRNVDGLVLPFRQETRMEGFKDGQKLLVDSVQVNRTLPAEHFGKPVNVATGQ